MAKRKPQIRKKSVKKSKSRSKRRSKGKPRKSKLGHSVKSRSKSRRKSRSKSRRKSPRPKLITDQDTIKAKLQDIEDDIIKPINDKIEELEDIFTELKIKRKKDASKREIIFKLLSENSLRNFLYAAMTRQK